MTTRIASWDVRVKGIDDAAVRNFPIASISVQAWLRPPQSPVSASLFSAPEPVGGALASAIATTELEIEALRLLNQAGADLGEQISLEGRPKAV